MHVGVTRGQSVGNRGNQHACNQMPKCRVTGVTRLTSMHVGVTRGQSVGNRGNQHACRGNQRPKCG